MYLFLLTGVKNIFLNIPDLESEHNLSKKEQHLQTKWIIKQYTKDSKVGYFFSVASIAASAIQSVISTAG